MSLQPRTLFAVEDDGLIRRLDFSDSDEENHLNLSNESAAECREISPFMEVNSPSTDESMNSSTDSVMSRPKTKRLTPVHKVDTTPPYRRVRALRLFGSPQSPKTLLKQSELTNAVNGGTVKDRPVISTPKPQPFDKSQSNLVRDRLTNSVFKNPFSPLDEDNISLFCPGSQTKRRRDNEYRSSFNNSSDRFDSDVDGECHPTKRLHLREGCMSRYEAEFVQVEQIGFGEFGSVYKCFHKLDGCVYAIKKSKKPLKGTSDERVALNEVWAHAVLGKHKHVVRYFSAWAENDHMLIQNEYCDGGSLAEAIERNRMQNRIFNEKEVKKILLHIALGLRYIHSLKLAHMDIKPGNIFISLQSNSSLSPDSIDDGFEDGEYVENSFTCKIGDLGHVTQITNPQVEEGDCRYMAPELLQDDYSDLPKADIFALGLTIYEVCGGGPLPKNGDAWHAIRHGKLPYLSNYSAELNSLLNKMTHRDPKQRPTSVELVLNRTLAPYQSKTKEQLNKELTQEKCKNRFLQKQLEMMQNSTKKKPFLRNNRVLGGKTNRSHSLTSF